MYSEGSVSVICYPFYSPLTEEEEARIVYDDEALDKLLDRTQAGQEEREMAMNEYFSSFKVATYAFKEEEVHVIQHI